MAKPTPDDVRVASRTDVGKNRDHNEDRVYVNEAKGVFLVIDGVGGSAGGEVAAKIAEDSIVDGLTSGDPPENRVREAIALANRNILKRAQKEPRLEGMSCVLTLALFENGQVTVGHVGDTRLYVLQETEMEKITSDHSIVGVLEEEGRLSEQEAMEHPDRNQILRDVGTEDLDPSADEFIDTYQFSFESDMAMLLCSDGLTDLVPAEDIRRTAREHKGAPTDTVDALIDEANRRGGKDNISVIVVEGPAFGPQHDTIKADNPENTDAEPRESEESPEDLENSESSSDPDRSADGDAGFLGRWRTMLRGGLGGLLLGILLVPLLMWQIPSLWEYAARLAPDETARVRQIHAVSTAGPGPSLQEALRAAQPGDILEVAPGTYYGPFRLRQGVSLMSQEPHKATLIAGSPMTADSAVVLARDIDPPDPYRTQLIGFRVVNPDTSTTAIGVLADGAAVDVINVRVEGFQRAGIEVRGRSSTPHLLQNSVVRNPGIGIHIRRGALPLVQGNIIRRNGAGRSEEGAGIRIEAGTRPDIYDNIVVDNKGHGIFAIRSSSSPLDREGNHFTLDTLSNSRGSIEIVKQ
jgi:serine/threonine protein phosphatase PrpC